MMYEAALGLSAFRAVSVKAMGLSWDLSWDLSWISPWVHEGRLTPKIRVHGPDYGPKNLWL